jgi:hypothetical protein
MKNHKILLVALGASALAVPAFADDATTTTSVPTAQQQCRTERADMGKATFNQTYGTNKNRRNAFGKCVSQRRHATHEAREDAQANAAQQCKAERAADPQAFADKYGTGKKQRNAYGKCVSQTAKAQTAETVDQETSADVNAAKACKAERKADSDAFAQKYGTKRNAFGKCVSQAAKAQHEQTEQDS